MPNEVNDIVDVVITIESSAVERQGFGTPLLVSIHEVGDPARIAYFSGGSILADMADAGHATNSPAYLQAAACLMQTPRPARIAIGRQDTLDADVTAAMNAIAAADNEGWYGFCHTTRTAAQVEDLAQWAETQNHLYSAQTADTAVRSGTGGNIAETLQTGGYRNTFLLTRYVAEDYADAAWLGKGLTADLDSADGQITWALKELTGCTPDTYTGAQRTTIHGYNANTYERRAGKNITFPGKSAQGEFIDIQVTVHWTDARMTEDLFAAKANTPTKIPFTQAGINVEETIIRRRLQLAVDNGHYSSYTVDIPKREDVLDSDFADRIFQTARWAAVPTGAIHTSIVRGRVTI